MENQTYKYLYKDVIKALKENHLLQALLSLQGMAATIKSWIAKDEIDNIIDSYHILLSYFANGTNDPERIKLYKKFYCRAYELAEILLREGDINDESSYYSTTLKTLRSIKSNHFLLSEILMPATPLRDIFDAVWTSGAWTIDDLNAIYNYMTDSEVCDEAKCLVLSATTLSATRYYDIAKVKLLLDQVLQDNIKLRVRAITGLVFVTTRYPERMELYPQAEAQLNLTIDNKDFEADFSTLQLQLFVSLETKRFERKLEDKIIPQMMKHIDTLRIDSSLGMDNHDKLTDKDLNPEWREQLFSPEMEKFVQEYTNLQLSGADVYMSSFKMLKNRFPFFNIPSNWFYPFTYNHPDIPQEHKDNKILKALLSNVALCDSDKYSMCLMFSQSGISSKLMANDKLESIIPDQMPTNAVPKSDKEIFAEEMRSYIQCFYRFSNLFAHREAFVNPFKENLFLFDYKEFESLLKNKANILNMANKLFKTKVYDIAQKFFAIIAQNEQNSDIYQKLGYCYEIFDDLDNAYNCYDKANILSPHIVWNLQRLATCACRLERYDKALQCYNELAETKTEDYNIALRQAECLIHLKRYDEAFQFLFKANYLSSESRNSERALAWCSLLTKKYEQAEKYYLRILASHPTPTDYLNAGHAAWLLGDYGKAVSRYKKCLPKDNPSNFLNADIPMLKEAGLNNDDIALMTDAVLSSL